MNNDIIKCPHCNKIFFNIKNNICPFCHKDINDFLDIFNDIFGNQNNPFNNPFNNSTDNNL